MNAKNDDASTTETTGQHPLKNAVAPSDEKAAAAKAEAARYKDTLNLPQTAFKMKAGAATREVELEAYWDENRVYEKMTQARDKSRRFLLHDGPPYLSSPKIHIGTALNKILKDIVVRYKSQRGFYAPYVPGYDGHGLPIENAVVKTLKGGRHSITPLELRKRCRDFAMTNLKGQESDFKRLGVWGHWEKPYITIDAAFEAAQVAAFGEMYEKGFVYKGLKPVYWCPHCETALADAEVEYDNHTSHSIYVKFPVKKLELMPDNSPDALEAATQLLGLQASGTPLSFVIWTTTPWTLPANLALSINPDFTYVVIDAGVHGHLIVAEKLLSTFGAAIEFPLDESQVRVRFSGKLLAETFGQTTAQHPFLARESIVLLGEHVTADAGTGVVHTAPGHGMDDYLVVQKYNRDLPKEQQIPILSPLDNSARFTTEAQVKELEGIFYEKGNSLVLDVLHQNNAILHDSKFQHSYPHCWRCHNPVIYRATEQWFADIGKFRTDALSAIENDVHWQPDKGRNRIYSMVEDRGDWCLSRQRVWGVPIPVLYCAESICAQPFITPRTIKAIRAQFEIHSSDIWWDEVNGSVDKLLADLPLEAKTCPHCKGTAFYKEMDIMDVWFDSGITHTAVIKARKDELGDLPADLYLEGSDQHRGWFQSSLLTSVMLYGKAPLPYKSVLTHGFVLDEQGRKMSKSLGNVVDPHNIIREVGADVLRLWVASVDYTTDVRIGKQTLHQLAEVYKKVRNTVRFIMGNLYDFDPRIDTVPEVQLPIWDRYICHRSRHYVNKITDAFEKWELYRYAHEIQWFCQVDLSTDYFNVTKDILYCDKPKSFRRRCVQTVLFEALKALLPTLVPVMPHLADDIWLSLSEQLKNGINTENLCSATLLPLPEYKAIEEFNFLEGVDNLNKTTKTVKVLFNIVNSVNYALEDMRQKKQIGNALDATAEITAHSKEDLEMLQSVSNEELEMLLNVSKVILNPEATHFPVLHEDIKLIVENEDSNRVLITLNHDPICERCRKHRLELVPDKAHSSICERCLEAVLSSNEKASASV
jgi:isoleucyl-tRNA synthetase